MLVTYQLFIMLVIILAVDYVDDSAAGDYIANSASVYYVGNNAIYRLYW
jgi:hypothetical protein